MISELKQDKSERIVDLCMWVDSHVYKEPIDHNKLFLNIQKIIYAISVNQRIFQNWEDYEPFSLVAATRVYNRYFNGKQFLEDGNPKKLTKIKSVLNYVKKLLYPMKVAYQNEAFKETIRPELHLEHTEAIRERMFSSARTQQNALLSIEFKYYVEKITNLIRSYIYSLPYKTDRVMTQNIYISCVLSFINSITLSNTIKKKLHTKQLRTSDIDQFLTRVYAETAENCIILFHLPDSMENYIATLLARIRHLVSKDFRELIGDNTLSEDMCNAVLVAQAQEVFSTNEQE